jgi:hypothetical protein
MGGGAISKVELAQIVLAPKWRGILCKVDLSLFTHLFDPDLEVISQHDTDKMKEFLRPKISI